MIDAPELVPEVVTVTDHAIRRYAERRNWQTTDDIAAGIYLLLQKAALKPTPPVKVGPQGCVRRYWVAGYCLVMDADLSRLITLYRERFKSGKMVRPR